ncbi:MAG: hypothetical protein J0H12_06080 [Candidatus Paracaedimonas acanthamoebae]|uniref:Uncharacterized protein n=1 Tax=Candidatus Paracaedimonas acanthamoebae TaxID=244581 RepID=A0A8J7TU18_9PROT|nr:hypothetical protein [Candidatus Paracaedimonas acanthamoebae]
MHYLLTLIFILAFSPLKAETHKEQVSLSADNQFSSMQCSSKKEQMCSPKTSAELSEEIRKLLENK